MWDEKHSLCQKEVPGNAQGCGSSSTSQESNLEGGGVWGHRTASAWSLGDGKVGTIFWGPEA